MSDMWMLGLGLTGDVIKVLAKVEAKVWGGGNGKFKNWNLRWKSVEFLWKL